MALPESPVDDDGELNHRLVWSTNSLATLDEMNEPVPGDTTVVGTYWAKVEPISGMEAMNARQLKPTTSHKVVMRNVGPIKPSDTLTFENTSRTFGIESVYRWKEQNSWLILHCTEQINPA